MVDREKLIDLTIGEWNEDYNNSLSKADALEILSNTQSYLKILEKWAKDDAQVSIAPPTAPAVGGAGDGAVGRPVQVILAFSTKFEN
ncbi:MAG: hypothetical protein A2270_01110 [Elusimicrobia bacterium RIFOXYA12_FULL_51_18]|nr:MAG: hypothetical protein A2270_01110 [Elusimicrobia bacterium RIFOXYA12_FULL_51_18]OGS31098.1 MAG: hypothetical protein A2218_02025 [Elusimicrobia bacterium RIFOXYA2_FULL_53_38]